MSDYPMIHDNAPIKFPSSVDIGIRYLCIPKHIADGFDFIKIGTRDVTIRHNETIRCDYAGSIKITIQNRSCFTGAIIFGEKIIVGSMVKDDLNMQLHPEQRSVISLPNYQL